MVANEKRRPILIASIEAWPNFLKHDKIGEKSRRILEMNIPVHPAGVMLRGDERYNPRFTREPEYRADGGSRITGVMRPDSPEGVAANPPLPELPFRFIVPPDANYMPINVEVWRRLQSGFELRAIVPYTFTKRS
jgi:hypothetical protein